MTILNPQNFFLLYLFSIGSIYKCQGQANNENASQVQKMEQLLNDKRKINASLSLNDTYKFQIFSGTSDMAKKALNEFRQEFEGIDATILFNTPNYKVLVGSFRTRIEAEAFSITIKNRYKNLLLIKPNK